MNFTYKFTIPYFQRFMIEIKKLFLLLFLLERLQLLGIPKISILVN